MNHKSELLSIHSSLLVKAICSFSICEPKQKFRRRDEELAQMKGRNITCWRTEQTKNRDFQISFRNVNIADGSGKKSISRENFAINYASKHLCSLNAPVGVFDRNNISRCGKCIFHVCHRELLWLGSFFLILVFPNYVGLKIDPKKHKSRK